jgi:hypothetical protein
VPVAAWAEFCDGDAFERQKMTLFGSNLMPYEVEQQQQQQ